MLVFKSNYILITSLLFITEVLIALFVHDKIVRPYFGDLLVVILLYCFLRSFLTWSIPQTCWVVVLFAYVIETLQYFNFVDHLGLANSKIAHVILGTSFAWMDILAYTLGILIVSSIEWLRISNQKTRTVKAENRPSLVKSI
jgi:hypothetical protein